MELPSLFVPSLNLSITHDGPNYHLYQNEELILTFSPSGDSQIIYVNPQLGYTVEEDATGQLFVHDLVQNVFYNFI